MRAALEYALQSGESFDVLHAHDWQAGLAPVYLRTRYAAEPRSARHGVDLHDSQSRVPGQLSARVAGAAGARPGDDVDGRARVLGTDQLPEGRHRLFSDSITTVSPTYAREIQTKEYGFGFEGMLAARAADLHGVLNGIDTDRWDPWRDPYLPEPYDETQPREEGRREARAVVGIARRRHAVERIGGPLVGIVSRLVDQKGFDLIAELAPMLPALTAALRCSGRGMQRYETMWRDLAAAHPESVRREDRVRRVAGASDRGGGRHVPDAVALRAVRAESDVQHAVRHGAGRPGHRRAGRHRYGLQ